MVIDGGDAMLQPGARVGNYVVELALRWSGTSYVYQARDAMSDRLATLAVLGAAQSPTPCELLDHLGIPRVYDCGMLEDHPWIASELVVGRTLASVLDRERLSVNDAVAIVRDAAEVLDHAHVRGVVHGHVTPEVIALPDGPRRFPLCILDWHAAGGSGAPAYAAPEQRRGEMFDDRADVFALGRVGRRLLHRACGSGAPPVFAALVQRMVADHPLDRPTAFEVRDHAGWLAERLEPVPAAVVHRHRPITSEVAVQISGEIDARRR